MPEPEHNDRPFPLLARLDPPGAVRHAAQFFRLLLARTVVGGRALPLISAGAVWAQLLTKAGERLEAWHRSDILEFCRLWPGREADPVALSSAHKPGDLETAGARGRLLRFGGPPARERTLSRPAEEKRSSRPDRLAALVGIDPADVLSGRTTPFLTTARTGGRYIVRRDRTPVTMAGASAKDTRPPTLQPSVQGYEDDRHEHGATWFMPGLRMARTVLSEQTTRTGAFPANSSAVTMVNRIFGRKAFITGRDQLGTESGSGSQGQNSAAFPARSSAVTMVNRIFGRKAFVTGRDQLGTESGSGSQNRDSVSLPHAIGGRQGTLPFSHATGRADSAPFWSTHAAQSLGSPLGVIPRVILERSFPDLNLSQVQVHTDAPADAAARDLGADAFVLGPDLFFRSGTFNPLTERGLALLTHELVHVRQSGDGPAPTTPSHRDRLEREAREIEGALQFPPVHSRPAQRHRTDTANRFSLRAFSALPLDLTRPSPLPSLPDRGMGSIPQRSVSRSPERFAASRPLLAETGRTAPPDAEQSAGSSSASTAQDQDGLSRHLFRALERKIEIEKERRGVDRWVP